MKAFLANNNQIFDLSVRSHLSTVESNARRAKKAGDWSTFIGCSYHAAKIHSDSGNILSAFGNYMNTYTVIIHCKKEDIYTDISESISQAEEIDKKIPGNIIRLGYRMVYHRDYTIGEIKEEVFLSIDNVTRSYFEETSEAQISVSDNINKDEVWGIIGGEIKSLLDKKRES